MTSHNICRDPLRINHMVQGDAGSPREICKADARGRFGNICLRLGNRVKDLQQRPVFSRLRKIDGSKNPELFLPLFALFWAQQLTTPHGNEIFWPAGFRLIREELQHPPGEQQTRGKIRCFVDDVVIVLGPRARIEMCLRFWEGFVLVAGKFESTKTPCRPFLAWYNVCGIPVQYVPVELDYSMSNASLPDYDIRNTRRYIGNSGTMLK